MCLRDASRRLDLPARLGLVQLHEQPGVPALEWSSVALVLGYEVYSSRDTHHVVPVGWDLRYLRRIRQSWQDIGIPQPDWYSLLRHGVDSHILAGNEVAIAREVAQNALGGLH